jgi:hypothetical protein
MSKKFTNNHAVASVATTTKSTITKIFIYLILLLLSIFVELWTLNLGPNTLSLNKVVRRCFLHIYVYFNFHSLVEQKCLQR